LGVGVAISHSTIDKTRAEEREFYAMRREVEYFKHNVEYYKDTIEVVLILKEDLLGEHNK
jgi:hypothetical protein